MLIDWFTVVAQIINFIVLMALLKRFLYRPIIEAMDKREASIGERMQEAQRQIEAAEREARTFRQKTSDLEAEQSALMETARQQAETAKEALVRQVVEEVEGKRRVWHEGLHQEKTAFFDRLQRQSGRIIVNICRQALTDLAGTELEQQMAQVLVQRLDQASQCFHQATRVTIASAFALSQATRQRIETLIGSRITGPCTFDYQLAPDLLCGIEIKANGVKVSWNLHHYLDGIGNALDLTLATKPASAAHIPEPDPPGGAKAVTCLGTGQAKTSQPT